jgi:hypothetical protein
MGQYKRTYTFEQYAVAWIDAALSSLPMETRQAVRPQVTKFYLEHKMYSILDRRRRYTSKDYAWAVAWGINTTGPALLRAVNKHGAYGVTEWMENGGAGDLMPKAEAKDHKPKCKCPICTSGAFKAENGGTPNCQVLVHGG